MPEAVPLKGNPCGENTNRTAYFDGILGNGFQKESCQTVQQVYLVLIQIVFRDNDVLFSDDGAFP